MGDDIGWFNVSAYNMGIMGYRTPNIDRIGSEGAVFTDFYGQQSCTAGRAAFITGQNPIRTGQPASSARITSEIAMSTCRRSMASMSFSAISII